MKDAYAEKSPLTIRTPRVRHSPARNKDQKTDPLVSKYLRRLQDSNHPQKASQENEVIKEILESNYPSYYTKKRSKKLDKSRISSRLTSQNSLAVKNTNYSSNGSNSTFVKVRLIISGPLIQFWML